MAGDGRDRAVPENKAAVTEQLLRELAAVNQDFRESVKMIRAELRPTVKVYRFGESPMSGQDMKLKRRYVI